MDEDARSTKGYRQRAADLRAEAETMTNSQTKKMMQDVAASYDQLARSLEAMARVPKGRNSN
jgi:hypothetical protein